MKKLILFFLLTIFIYTNSFSQSNSLTYLKQVLYKATLAAALYSYSYTFEEGSNLTGAFLEKGQDINISYELKAYNDYVIIGVGDDDVKDLDLILYDNNWKVLKKDQKTDDIPIIEFSCYKTGEYIINLKNYNSKQPSFCVFLILKKGSDIDNSIMKFAEAVDNIVLLYDKYSEWGSDFIRNSICLFGGIYGSGGYDYFGNFEAPYSGSYSYLAIGSDNIKDVDITLYRQLNNTDPTDATIEIAKDIDKSKVAIVSSYLYSYYRYKLYYKNYKSTGKGYIICLVLKDYM